MLTGVISSRPKYWLLNSSPLISHYHRHIPSHDATFPPLHNYIDTTSRFNNNNNMNISTLWQTILPATSNINHHHHLQGEGSWNVTWDVRPARWLHRPHTAWLLFSICACLATPPLDITNNLYDNNNINVLEAADDHIINTSNANSSVISDPENSLNYRITGVAADGRCLFRAIAHLVCLRNGEEAPDETRQMELADQLRAQVVDELFKRQKEIEWFIEGDFETYCKRMEKPFVWGGEPELLMASHVLKTTISVFMLERSSNKLFNIATYGKEYQQDKGSPIKVLFHGYGHYDILEEIS
uniref:deubiquitinase OTUD6B-like n=1 Tax=Erigeron canadensis TaxID=72917 RepID=UPI001CB9A3BE|nr:deubiquitinase OTUD6B-like [Erigeron canadensis]